MIYGKAKFSIKEKLININQISHSATNLSLKKLALPEDIPAIEPSENHQKKNSSTLFLLKLPVKD